MKKLFLIALISTLGFTACEEKQDNAHQQNEQTASEGEVVNLSVQQMAEKMKAEKGVILDVRTPEEYQAGHLISAELHNIYDEAFEQKLSELDKNKIYYVYCKAGGRSTNAATKMKEMGFKKIYNMEGGFTAWQDANLPSE